MGRVTPTGVGINGCLRMVWADIRHHLPTASPIPFRRIRSHRRNTNPRMSLWSHTHRFPRNTQPPDTGDRMTNKPNIPHWLNNPDTPSNWADYWDAESQQYLPSPKPPSASDLDDRCMTHPNPNDVWVVRPGDYVAIIYNGLLDSEQRHRARTELKTVWPDVRCVLFEGDWDIKVMRPDDTCPDCDGGGAGEEQTPWKTNPCERCDGTGTINPSEDE